MPDDGGHFSRLGSSRCQSTSGTHEATYEVWRETETILSESNMTSLSVEDLSDSQFETFKQFKRNISDFLPPDLSDAWLIKWLRTENYNLKKAETHFKATMRLRQVYEFDSLAENYVKPEVCSKYEFATSLGIAKNGSPIRYSHVGRGDLLGFLLALNGYDICMYCSYVMEYDMALIRKENERTGRQVNEVTYIVDMDGFSIQTLLNKAAIETGLDLLQMMQEVYPEIWGNIFVINAPSYFDRAFNIFKPMLRLSMLQRIRVASKDSTPALLRKYIDEDVLPAYLGGKKVDSQGDPKCSEFIPQGGTISEEYYIRNLVAPLQPTDPGVRCVWVGARSVFNHCEVVRRPDARIQLEFRTENGGIGLKMLYREFGDDPSHPDVPSSDEYLDDGHPGSNVLYVSTFLRMQSHTTPVVPTAVRAPWPGIYIYRFDNTHSWFRSKKIIFRCRILEES